mmetsp:Transcript_4088/g.14632  ORF Transcript_4088/g.14632 Transcript_4088/m.14632 type:complete len:745 (-) Transcript_4088:228-2462(-)
MEGAAQAKDGGGGGAGAPTAINDSVKIADDGAKAALVVSSKQEPVRVPARQTPLVAEAVASNAPARAATTANQKVASPANQRGDGSKSGSGNEKDSNNNDAIAGQATTADKAVTATNTTTANKVNRNTLTGLDAVVEAALPSGTGKDSKLAQGARTKGNGKGNGDEGGSSSGSTGSAEKLTKQDKNEFAREPNTEEERARNKNEEEQQGRQNTDRTEKVPRPSKVASCPRCHSLNTKFCYYNNYNVNQPRHFCKACQRYWTEGGTLRNVPVGAGRRRNKNSLASSKQGGQDKALLGAHAAALPGVAEGMRAHALPGVILDTSPAGLISPTALRKGPVMSTARPAKEYASNERQKSPDGSGDGSAEGSSIRMDAQAQRNAAHKSDADQVKRSLKPGVRQRSLTTLDTTDGGDGSGGDGSGSGSGSGGGGYHKNQGKDGSRTWAQVTCSSFMNPEANKQQAPRPGGPVVAPGGNWARQMMNSMRQPMPPYGYPAPWHFGWPQYPPAGWHGSVGTQSGGDSQKNSQSSNSMQFSAPSQAMQYPWMYPSPPWAMGPQPGHHSDQQETSAPHNAAVPQVMAQGPWPAYLPGMIPPWFPSNLHEQQGVKQQRGRQEHTGASDHDSSHQVAGRGMENLPGVTSQQMFHLPPMGQMTGMPYGPMGHSPGGQIPSMPPHLAHGYPNMQFNVGSAMGPDPAYLMSIGAIPMNKGMEEASGPGTGVRKQEASKGKQGQRSSSTLGVKAESGPRTR